MKATVSVPWALLESLLDDPGKMAIVASRDDCFYGVNHTYDEVSMIVTQTIRKVDTSELPAELVPDGVDSVEVAE